MTTTVRDNPEESRYEVLVGDQVAGFADYRRSQSSIMFTHAEVDDAHEGQGVGSQLVVHALDAARAAGLAVLPRCQFVAEYIQRHPEYADLVPENRQADFGL